MKYTSYKKDKSYQSSQIKKIVNQFKIPSEKETIITNKDILELLLYSQREIEESTEYTKVINLYNLEKPPIKKERYTMMQKEAYKTTKSNLKKFLNE